MADTLALFPGLEPATAGSEWIGLRYADAVVSTQAQVAFVDQARTLDFAPFDFRGFKGHRRTVSICSRYDFDHNRLDRAEALPEWLTTLRGAAARFAEIDEVELVKALITEYAPGAGIGWRRDRPEYGKVVGLSFGSDCVLRFRRWVSGGWRRASHALRPGSAYLLDGPARDAWQHSITPGDQLRYSITFRTLRQSAQQAVARQRWVYGRAMVRAVRSPARTATPRRPRSSRDSILGAAILDWKPQPRRGLSCRSRVPSEPRPQRAFRPSMPRRRFRLRGPALSCRLRRPRPRAGAPGARTH